MCILMAQVFVWLKPQTLSCKIFFPYFFVFLCYYTMFSGPPISLPSSSIFDVSNFMWSINSSNIFVDFHYNDELFIDSCFVIENVYQFHVLFPPKCNPNLFGHFFILTFL
jgi:hypothetical protein